MVFGSDDEVHKLVMDTFNETGSPETSNFAISLHSVTVYFLSNFLSSFVYFHTIHFSSLTFSTQTQMATATLTMLNSASSYISTSSPLFLHFSEYFLFAFLLKVRVCEREREGEGERERKRAQKV